MDGQLDHFVNELKQQLSHLDRKIRSLALLRGLGLIVLMAICLVALQISLDLLFALSTTTRIILTSISAIILTLSVWFGLLRNTFHKRTPVELAAIVEESQTTLNERLTSVLELSSAQNEPSSILMREQLAKETIVSLSTFNITDSVPANRTMRFVISASIAILIFLTPLLFWPDAYSLLLSRSVTPWGNFATVSSLYFEVEPGDKMLARGKDLQITATPRWHTKQPGKINNVWIKWEDSNGEQFSRRMDLDQASGQYVTQFSRLLAGFQYTISTERSQTQRYTIQIAEPPSIIDSRLTITPPGYTHSKPQEFTVLPSEMSAPEQSQISISLTFDRPVTEATFQYQLYGSNSDPKQRHPMEQKDFVLSQDHLTARLELPVHEKSFLFHIKLTNEEGNLTTQTSEHLVKVIPDRAPEIELSSYNQSEYFKPNETITLPVMVTDDFSVEELELHVNRLDEKPIVIKAPINLLRTASVEHEFKIDLEQIKAEQSDIFTYRIRAADNREIPSPNVVWSTPRVFGVDKNADQQLASGVTSRQQKLRDELRKIKEDFEKHSHVVDQKIAELNQPTQKDELEELQKKQLQELTTVERKIAQRLETLANEFLQLPLYQKLAKQTQEVARQDFVKNHDMLKSAAEAETTEQAQKALEPTPKSMSATEKKLSQLAAQYDKLVTLENDLLNLDRLAEDTSRLADDLLAFNDKVESAIKQPQGQSNEKQEQLSTPEKNQPKPKSSENPHLNQQNLTPEMQQDLANLQAELKHRQSRLSKDLDELIQRRPELVDAARNYQLKQLESLVNQTSQLIEPQTMLAEAIQQQAPVSAGKPVNIEPNKQRASEPDNNSTANEQPQTSPKAKTEPSTQAARNTEPQKQATTPMNKMEPTDAAATQNLAESVLELQKRQQELAAEAADFVLETAQQFGTESEPTRKATQLARESIAAQQEVNAGRLHEASQAANRASQMAQEIMKAHQAQNKEQTERDAFLEQVEKLANNQRELAAKMEQASTSEASRQQALQNAQQSLAQQTSALSNQLAETSQKLETEPIGLKKEGQQADRTRKKISQAKDAMQKTVENISKANLKQAAQQAKQAAKTLQAAAKQVQNKSRKKQKSSPVPEKVGDQVTDAAMQLRNAQKQLEQSPEFKGGDPTLARKQQAEPSSSKSNQNQGSKQKSSQSGNEQNQAKSESSNNSKKDQVAQNSKNQNGQSESGKPSQPSASKEAAQSLKRAAESLSQASSELKSKAQQGATPGKGQASQSASKNEAQGNGQGESQGGGTKGSVDFTQLQIKLKAMSNRNWGELPGNLDTEILQGSHRGTDPEYARLIKHYFEAIAKSKPDGE